MSCESSNNNSQCCAFDENKRCTGSTIRGSNHCIIHYKTAHELYKKYKRDCKIAYNWDIKKKFDDIKSEIQYYLKYYMWLNKAYNARLKHMKYAFVPECSDAGHNYQFVLINDKIKECEIYLNNLYEKYKKSITYKQELVEDNTSDDLEVDSDNINNAEISINNLDKKIINMELKRAKQEQQVNNLMDKYIEENKSIISEREKLHEFYTNVVKKLCGVSTNKKIILYGISLYSLVCELKSCGYFNPEFKMKTLKCSCGRCADDFETPIKLGCTCMLQKKTLSNCLNIFSELSIKLVAEYALRNKEKIEPIIEDLANLYAFYDYEVIRMELKIRWFPKESRFKLIQGGYKDLTKLELRKLDRMRKNVREQKEQELEVFDFSDDDE